MKYIVCTTTKELSDTKDSAFRAYYEREIAARGLQDGDGLDVRWDGTRVHITTEYQAPITIEGDVGGLYPVDALVETVEALKEADGKVAAVDAKDVPAKYAALVTVDAVADEELIVEKAVK